MRAREYRCNGNTVTGNTVTGNTVTGEIPLQLLCYNAGYAAQINPLRIDHGNLTSRLLVMMIKVNSKSQNNYYFVSIE